MMLAAACLLTFSQTPPLCCLRRYLQRDLWAEDYMLASSVLRVLEPCLHFSDQVKHPRHFREG